MSVPIVGIDEAGKGPVLGPMAVAAVRAPPAALPDGIGDSKELSERRRERLDADLRADDRIEISVETVGVDRIDDPATDMNALTLGGHVTAAADLVQAGDIVWTDAGDVDAARFGRRVAAGLDPAVDVRAEHGADERRDIVGAASVVAKVARDDRIAAIAADHGAVGSGYPSDATTRAFLREYVTEHGDVPPFARRSWRTCQDVLAADAQSSLEEF